MLGWEAAVIAMVSPSHPRPAVIQSTEISDICLSEFAFETDFGACGPAPRNRVLSATGGCSDPPESHDHWVFYRNPSPATVKFLNGALHRTGLPEETKNAQLFGATRSAGGQVTLC